MSNSHVSSAAGDHVQSSMDDDRSDNGTRTQQSPGKKRADPSHNDAEHEATPIPTAENQHVPSKDGTGNESRYDPVKVELYQAALKGDWKAAKTIFDSNSSAITMKITGHEETALHIAAAASHISFVENLVHLITTKEDLAAKNIEENTALAFAAASGVVRIAQVMVRKNDKLPNLRNCYEIIPVFMAVTYKRKDMASYLFSTTDFEALHQSEQIGLLIATISADYYDIALDILEKNPELAVERMENGDTALHVLARKPYAIGSSNKLGFWKRHINSRFNRIYNKALMQTLAHQTVERVWYYVLKNFDTFDMLEFIKEPSRLLHDAARVGNAEFLIILIRSYPDLIWKVDNDKKSIFHIAVENRQENVFNLIYEIGGLKDFLANYHDQEKNSNMLHLAGTLAAPYHLSRVSGAALQMQRELLWFKEVEKIVLSSHHGMRRPIREPSQVKLIRDPVDIQNQFKQLLKSGEEWMKNKASSCILMAIPELSEVKIVRDQVDKLTPRELFTKEHKQLLISGEKWMKTTANSCMLVATLIATVVFAAAFTVPGGNDNAKGIPIFRQNHAFTVFVISDVVALVLSITSILAFLSILTSRYAEDDFLVWLPSKLLFGLLTLLLSIACMVVAFSAAFFIAYDKTKAKIRIAIAVLAFFPVGCFCVLHSKLMVDIFRSFSLRHHKKKLF